MTKKIIPATVFTGFLGSGKTTIIMNLLKDLNSKNQKVAFLKNEIGEADLDSKLIQGQNFLGKEILNGCICCTLVGPFMSAIDELIDDFEMDRIIIESAGSADPASMALMVSNHPRLSRDGVIGVVDVVNFEGYEDLTPVAKRQAELTDLIVLNKVELAEVDQKKRAVAYVRELNAFAPIVEAPGGKLNPDLAFGVTTYQLDDLLDHDSHSDHNHLTTDKIDAYTFESDSVFDYEKFSKAITSLPKNVFRVKGIVSFTDKPRVVNSIYKRADFFDLPDNFSIDKKTKLICIGYMVNQVADQIGSVFALSEQNPD